MCPCVKVQLLMWFLCFSSSLAAEGTPNHRGVWRLLTPHHLLLNFTVRNNTIFVFGVFYISCMWWQVRLCPVPVLIVFGKHFLTLDLLFGSVLCLHGSSAPNTATVIYFDGLSSRTKQKPGKASLCVRESHKEKKKLLFPPYEKSRTRHHIPSNLRHA